MMFDAWWLPALTSNPEIDQYQNADLTIRSPRISADELNHVIAQLRASHSTLAGIPLERIVSAIDAAAQKLAADSSVEALLVHATGYSRENVARILDHMFEDWSAASLSALIDAELPDRAVLEGGFRGPTGVRTMARGAPLSFHIFSGNVPGVAVTSLIRSLLVKSPVLGKTASGEPVLPVLFAKALADVDPEIAKSIAVTYWPGGSTQLEEVALQAAECIVVYGGAETIESVRARVTGEKRVLVHGPKISFGIVRGDADERIAAEIAQATAAYDQQGCVSPHVAYVLGTVEQARAVAQRVATALDEYRRVLPRRAVSASEALAMREARARAEFGSIKGEDVEVFGPRDTSYTVIYEADKSFAASCLNRTLYVKPLARAGELVEILAPYRHVLQSAAIAGFSGTGKEDITMLLVSCGVTRVTNFKQLPWPPMWWHHDGRGPLNELLFWNDVEV